MTHVFYKFANGTITKTWPGETEEEYETKYFEDYTSDNLTPKTIEDLKKLDESGKTTTYSPGGPKVVHGPKFIDKRG